MIRQQDPSNQAGTLAITPTNYLASGTSLSLHSSFISLATPLNFSISQCQQSRAPLLDLFLYLHIFLRWSHLLHGFTYTNDSQIYIYNLDFSEFQASISTCLPDISLDGYLTGILKTIRLKPNTWPLPINLFLPIFPISIYDNSNLIVAQGKNFPLTTSFLS